LDWRKFVQEKKGMLSPQKTFLVGDAGKLKTITNWKPSLSFQQMIEKIIDDLK
jgi:GDP-D-mannose dehydratase